MSEEFDVKELSDFAQKFSKKMSAKYPKEVKKFLQKEGNKLRKRAIQKTKSKLKKKTGNYLKGYKRGKVYKYCGDEDSVRVYNSKPHAHLIEYGHRIVGKDGKEHGFKKGEYILRSSTEEFYPEFIQNTENWVDEMLEEGFA